MKTAQEAQIKLFETISSHLLQDETPSLYLNTLKTNSEFQNYPFQCFVQLIGLEQSPKYHPEGDVWTHTMMVVDEAAKVRHLSSSPTVFMWSSLLHDIGKPSTTKIRKGRITSYDHDREGASMAESFLTYFDLDPSFIQEVKNLVRYHMHILYVVNKLPYGDIKGLKRDANIKDVALLGWCDRMGRGNADAEQEKKVIETFYDMMCRP